MRWQCDIQKGALDTSPFWGARGAGLAIALFPARARVIPEHLSSVTAARRHCGYMQVPIAERTRAGGHSWEFAIQSMIVETQPHRKCCLLG